MFTGIDGPITRGGGGGVGDGVISGSLWYIVHKCPLTQIYSWGHIFWATLCWTYLEKLSMYLSTSSANNSSWRWCDSDMVWHLKPFWSFQKNKKESFIIWLQHIKHWQQWRSNKLYTDLTLALKIRKLYLQRTESNALSPLKTYEKWHECTATLSSGTFMQYVHARYFV